MTAFQVQFQDEVVLDVKPNDIKAVDGDAIDVEIQYKLDATDCRII